MWLWYVFGLKTICFFIFLRCIISKMFVVLDNWKYIQKWNKTPEKTRITSCSTDGRVPPSLNRPHPVTVAFSPMRRSSEPGKHIGTMCGVYCIGASNRTMAKSYSYVKKLYLGWTIFLATARSTNGNGSFSDEKSYSPTRIRICDVSKL